MASSSGCACCPYPLAAIPGFLIGLAAIMTWVAAFNCNFYVIRETTPEVNSTDLGIGLWTIQDIPHGNEEEHENSFWHDDDDDWEEGENNCVVWSERYGPAASSVELDSAMVAARVFSLTAALLSLVAFCVIIVSFCVAFADSTRYSRVMSGMCVTIGVCVLFDLVALASNICKGAESCSMENAGIIAIVVAFMWFLIAGLMLVVFKVENVGYPVERTVPQPSVAPTTEREVRTVQNLDGSTTTITKTTTTNSDGTQTVTESTEVTEAPVQESVPLAESVLIPEESAIPVASVMSVETEQLAASVTTKP